jgi:hypothetical protein
VGRRLFLVGIQHHHLEQDGSMVLAREPHAGEMAKLGRVRAAVTLRRRPPATRGSGLDWPAGSL